MENRANIINTKESRCNKEQQVSCEEIRISRMDLKRKNYKNSETVLTKNTWQNSRHDPAGATVLLLDRMWKDRGP